MTQERTWQQGFHAALIHRGLIFAEVKHFPAPAAEMLQEILPHDVDLGPDHP